MSIAGAEQFAQISQPGEDSAAVNPAIFGNDITSLRHEQYVQNVPASSTPVARRASVKGAYRVPEGRMFL